MKNQNNNQERDLKMFKRYLKGETIQELAARFHLSQSQVYAIAKSQRWKEALYKVENLPFKDVIAEVEKENREIARLKSQNYRQDESGRWYYDVTTVYPPSETPRRFGLFKAGESKDYEFRRISNNSYVMRYFVADPAGATSDLEE